MQYLAGLAIRRPVAVLVTVIVLAVLGLDAWRKLPVELFPDLRSPTVLIAITSGDRPAQQMERIYGERLEQQLFTVAGIKSITQTARNGRLVCRVTFDWDVDVDMAVVDVNRAVAPIAGDREVDQLRISRQDSRLSPVMVLGITAGASQLDLADLRSLARRELAPVLEQLPGVAQVRVGGGRVREVKVRIDPVRLKAYGFTVTEVRNQIRANNLDVNAGTLEEGGEMYLVHGKSRFVAPEDVAQVVLGYAEGERSSLPVRVSDIAAVQVGHADVDNTVRVDGGEGVGLFVYKEADANTVEVSSTLRQALEQLKSDMPGLQLTLVNDESSLILDAIADVEAAALIGVLLAVSVLVAFLRSAGAVVIVAIAVPVSMLVAVLALGLTGRSLNLMTLGGLALGAGMLVDNTIVVIESIFRRRERGDTPAQAAITGVGRVGGAIAASTLTTCVVFLPLIFLEGLASRLVEGIAFAVVISLTASLLVALFLIPVLASGLLPQGVHRVRDNVRSDRVELWVGRLLHRPGQVTLVALLGTATAAFGLSQLGTELIPPSDPRQFSVQVRAEAGSDLEATQHAVAQIENIITAAADTGVGAILSEVGRLKDDDRIIRERYSDEHTAVIHVRLLPAESAATVVAAARPALDRLHGMKLDWQLGNNAIGRALGTQAAPITVELQGRSLDNLRRASGQVVQAMQQLPAVWNVSSSFSGAPKEVHLRLKRPLADGLGVDLETLRTVISAALDGLQATEFAMGDETRQVVIEMPHINLQSLLGLSFTAPSGQLVSVGDVVDLQIRDGAREIIRRDQRRVAQVTALTAEGVNAPQARAQVVQALLQIPLPPGIQAKLSGAEQQRQETFSELYSMAALALLLVFMVLAAHFESLRAPFIILSTVPMALVGVALVLLPQGQPLGVMAGLGLVILAGIAVNDAILYAQSARQLCAEGVPFPRALARAVAVRLRPIVMTTATTVLSLLPLAITGDQGAELRSPLAWTVIGGLIFSTLACLTVVPCLFLLVKPFPHESPQARH
ncbi:efflux RND transporter permease subunit [Microbulbifer sp. 2201CG32-9]|uniref:efflux RND transporter permease subunit n=1 Tax=Microbulbifer sp. 2201CG32-9 TaxID=3232309 RepID=UPI00345C1CBD